MSESFTAVGARVWLLTRVNEQVILQVNFAAQCFLTDIASVAVHWHRHSQVFVLNMSFQCLLPSESVLTFSACELVVHSQVFVLNMSFQ